MRLLGDPERVPPTRRQLFRRRLGWRLSTALSYLPGCVIGKHVRQFPDDLTWWGGVLFDASAERWRRKCGPGGRA